jgi:hypothetical protein
MRLKGYQFHWQRMCKARRIIKNRLAVHGHAPTWYVVSKRRA